MPETMADAGSGERVEFRAVRTAAAPAAAARRCRPARPRWWERPARARAREPPRAVSRPLLGHSQSYAAEGNRAIGGYRGRRVGGGGPASTELQGATARCQWQGGDGRPPPGPAAAPETGARRRGG